MVTLKEDLFNYVTKVDRKRRNEAIYKIGSRYM